MTHPKISDPLALLGVSLALLAWPGAARGADVYNLVLLRVTFSDTTSTPYTAQQLGWAALEIEGFFGMLSNDNLELHVDFVEQSLPHSLGRYWTRDWRGGWILQTIDGRDGAVVLLEDAVRAAALTGTDFSTVDGVTILHPFCGPTDWTNGPHRFAWQAGSTRSFERAYDFECVNDPRWSPPGNSGVWWGAWAHELGHQLQSHYGMFFGHPSGYLSGYDLMDSCYPCGDTAFALSGPPVVSREAQVFPGWLPIAKTVVVAAPVAGASGQTVVLAPLSVDPKFTTAPQAIQIPVSRGVYYIVEARVRQRADALNIGPGIWDEGVQIILVEEGRQVRNDRGDLIPIPVVNIDWCDTKLAAGCVRQETDPRWADCWGAAAFGRVRGDKPDYCWPFPLWHAGESFYDATYAVEIRVDPAAIGGAFPVTITRGAPPGYPDVLVLPWLTPPTHTWESVDIWVDSSCNGYEAEVGPSGLRYGRRGDGTVIGNGDDPCIDHENRLYASVHNGGAAPALDVRVTFRVTDPLGVGVPSPEAWTVVGTATEVDTPALASLGAGETTDVYVTWTPVVSLAAEELAARRFAFHTCVQVRVEPVAGEIVTSNQDGIDEQENIETFEARLGIDEPIYPPVEGTFFLRNDGNSPRDYHLDIASALPAGWSYAVGDGETDFRLPPGTHPIPVRIDVPAGEAIGNTYSLRVGAWTLVDSENLAVAADSPYRRHRDALRQGGVLLEAHTVQETTLSLHAYSTATSLEVGGELSVPRAAPGVTLDFQPPHGARTTHLVPLDAAGAFKDSLPVQSPGTWTLRAIWQGDALYASAVSPEVRVVYGLGVPAEGGGCTCHSGGPALEAAILGAILALLWRQRRRRRGEVVGEPSPTPILHGR